MEPKEDINTWIHSSKSAISQFSIILDENNTVHLNDITHAIHRTEVLLHHFNDKFQWWKNSVKPTYLHDADLIFKKLKKLLVELTGLKSEFKKER